MKFTNIFLILLLLNYKFIECKYNRLIRVDGINPTCYERPECRDFEVDAALINVDKSLPYMGSSTCCLIFDAEDSKNQYFMARILSPTFLGGNDYISFFKNDFNTLIANITSIDKNPYRIIYLNSSKIIVEIHKDKNYRSTFDILLTAYYNKSSRKCLKDKFICEQSNICIDKDLECDRFSHCIENEDEENCNNGPFKIDENDLKPTVSIALGVLIGVLIIMIITSLLCCLCKRKGKIIGLNSASFMRIFGSTQINRSQFYRTNVNNVNLEEQREQQTVRINMTHSNRNKLKVSNKQQNSLSSQTASNKNIPPPSYEEAKLLENNK